MPAEGIPERFSIAWFNQPTPTASLKTCVDVTSISESASSPHKAHSLRASSFTMLNHYLADDLARMNRKGVKPGTDLTADEHLQARLSSTYSLRKK